MAKYEDVSKVIDCLEDLKNHEANYAEINKYLSLINATQALKDVAECMASDLAEKIGKTKEEVLAGYYAKI